MLLEQLRDREREERRHERGSLLEDVAAVEDRPHDRGVRRRAADAALLERLHERRLGVPRRRASSRGPRARAADASTASPTSSGGSRRSSSPFFDSSSRPSSYAARKPRNVITVPEAPNSASRPSVAGRAESQRHRLAARVLHLRGDRALPDELVERVLVARELALDLAPASGTCRPPGGSPRGPPARS